VSPIVRRGGGSRGTGGGSVRMHLSLCVEADTVFK